ncbi:MAG: FtsH protease activity modulator HflK [Alphaproteobacteria bacterium]|nr:FtsH protease activity modulator HflK [Alphaproteobacteria bacterium]
MPWNDQKGGGGGPWGGGSGGSGGGDGESPWGRPSRPGPRPSDNKPDLEESLRRMQERFRRRGGGNGGSSGGSGGGRGRTFGAAGLLILLVIAVVGWLMTGVYQVNEQQVAVVLRFGKPVRTEGPGFHIRLPNPIEDARVVPINTITETKIGERGEEESLMLTGDENIVDINFSINWKINSPQLYLFNIADPTELIRQIGESAMREVVGTSQFEPITAGDRTGVESRVRDLMQQTLNSYQSGVEIVSISLKQAQAPAEVLDQQRDVSAAEQDKVKRENEAKAYRNDVVPRARGQAQKIIQDAEAYKAASVAIAQGDAERFNLIYDQYQKAPKVTRERMYLETMERVLGRSNKVVIDSKNGTVPVLPLDMFRNAPAEKAAQ